MGTLAQWASTCIIEDYETRIHSGLDFRSMCSSSSFDYPLFPISLDLSTNSVPHPLIPLLNKVRRD